MIGSGAAYQKEERLQIKALQSHRGIAPTHFPQELPFLSPSPLETATKCVFTPVLQQRDACQQMSKQLNKRLLDCAQTSYAPVWLLWLLLYQASTTETAGVLAFASCSSPASDFCADRKGGSDLKLDSAYRHSAHEAMADINEEFVCKPWSIAIQLKKDSERKTEIFSFCFLPHHLELILKRRHSWGSK